jgi:ribosomal protein S27AE
MDLSTNFLLQVENLKNPTNIFNGKSLYSLKFYNLNFFFCNFSFLFYSKNYLKCFFKIFNFSKLIGGGKKRKKKNYTKPKKIKHLKKKIKLRILNYYSVREGKIQKIRKESPQSPGCFMAEHFDRFTCGKTGLTLVKSV